MRIKLIPDTNILIHHCQQLEILIKLKHRHFFFVFIPRIVIQELDGLKQTLHAKVSKATEFIENNNENGKVVIEGQGCIGKMDIVQDIDIDVESLLKGNNDDKILRFLFDHLDAVFMTNDRLLSIKAQSYNIFCILVGDFDVNRIALTIMGMYREYTHNLEHPINETHNLSLNYKTENAIHHEYTHNKSINYLKKDETDSKMQSSLIHNTFSKFKGKKEKEKTYQKRDMTREERITFNIIYGIVSNVVKTKNLVDFRSKKNTDLRETIAYVIRNFNYFQSYFSINIKQYLLEIEENLKGGVNIVQNCNRLLIIFRQDSAVLYRNSI